MFYYKYKKNGFTELVSGIERHESEYNELGIKDIEDKIITFLESNESRKDWFNKEVFKLYLKEGSYRNVEKKTGIGYGTVSNCVNEVRERIKKEYGRDYINNKYA